MLGLRILVGLDAIGAPCLVPCKFFNARCCAASLPTTSEETPYWDSAYSGALRPIKYSSRAKVSMGHSVESPANMVKWAKFCLPGYGIFRRPGSGMDCVGHIGGLASNTNEIPFAGAGHQSKQAAPLAAVQILNERNSVLLRWRHNDSGRPLSLRTAILGPSLEICGFRSTLC